MLFGCALLILGSGRAIADPVPVRRIGIVERGNMLLASVGLQDLFTATERERLTSGFSTRVLVRVFLRREGDPEPVAVAFQRAEIVYDIWDERFRIRVTRGPGSDRTIEAPTPEGAIAAATTLWQFPIADQTQLDPGHRYFLAVRGDLNPLSQELQAEVRRWLRQPAGAQRRPGAGGGDSFFGSFVTVFVNPQIDDSEHQVRFISQTFGVPRR
jgi:Domain of unknown function (DUF4390)